MWDEKYYGSECTTACVAAVRGVKQQGNEVTIDLNDFSAHTQFTQAVRNSWGSE